MSKSLLLLLAIFLTLFGCNPKSTPENKPNESLSRARYLLAYDTSTGKEAYRTKFGYPTLAGGVGQMGPVYDGKLFLGTADDNENRYVSALEVSSGKELWTTAVKDANLEQTLFLARRGVMGHLDPNTGKLADQPRDLPGNPYAWNDPVAYCATDSEVVAFDTKDWKESWRAKLPGVNGAIQAEDGTLVFRNPNGCQAFKSTGEPSWEYNSSHAPSALATRGPTVYLATAEPRLIALDSTTGETTWEKSWKQESYWHAPLLYEELIILTVGESVLALDRKTGEEKWKAPRPHGDFVLDETSGVLYCYDMKADEITSYNSDDGKELATWKVDLNATALMIDGKLLLAETVDKPVEGTK